MYAKSIRLNAILTCEQYTKETIHITGTDTDFFPVTILTIFTFKIYTFLNVKTKALSLSLVLAR